LHCLSYMDLVILIKHVLIWFDTMTLSISKKTIDTAIVTIRQYNSISSQLVAKSVVIR